jgi:dihydroorotate dehydrogenase (fumarate)
MTSINSFGYSPHPLSDYIVWIEELLISAQKYKPIIVSITSNINDPASLSSMVDEIQRLRKRLHDQVVGAKARIAIELNTSCPNIQGSPPSAYDFHSLGLLLQLLAEAHARDPTLTIGLKLPPYLHEQQFRTVINGITTLTSKSRHGDSKSVVGTNSEPGTAINHSSHSVISFLTCTNTLGNSLLFADQSIPLPAFRDSALTEGFALPTGLGGLAGDALHPLALGNVYRFSQLLKEPSQEDHSTTSGIKIIGVGGVTSKAALERMKVAGADAVACATLFGKEGVRAFEILSKD